MFHKVKLSSIYLLFAALLFSGCGSKEDNPPDDPEDDMEEYTVGQNVFASGFENEAHSNPLAKVWKNGVVQNFTKSAGNMVRSSETAPSVLFSIANSVFASGGDVYVTGCELLTSDYAPISRARLWKNGEKLKLDVGKTPTLNFILFLCNNVCAKLIIKCV